MSLDEKDRVLSEVDRLKKAIYEENVVGCCLHIVFDDFNYNRTSGEFCLKYAQEKGHVICEAAAKAFLKLSDKQMKWMYDNPELSFSLVDFMPKELR